MIVIRKYVLTSKLEGIYLLGDMPDFKNTDLFKKKYWFASSSIWLFFHWISKRILVYQFWGQTIFPPESLTKTQYMDLLIFSRCCKTSIKGTVIQIEKALMNDPLRVSKVSWKFRIRTIYNFPVNYPWNLLFS